VTLEAVRRFRVPKSVIEKTEEALRGAGKDGYELFVLWSGVVDGDVLEIKTPHVPRQSSFRLRSGLLVRVDGDALHKLNAWLYERQELLAVQVHAHPTEAFHSETDDAFPIVTVLGGLSLVACDFARHGLLSRGAAAYRLSSHGWQEVRSDDLKALLEVVG
jgi:hypothetical protein